MPPPANPQEIPSAEEFRNAERVLSKLPADYKEFLCCYGTGSVDGFIWIFSPSATSSNLNLFNQAKRQIEVFRDLGHSEPALKKYPLFPEPDGLLPVGITDNGDALFWRTAERPDDWEIVITAAREPKTDVFHGNLVAFLSDLLKGVFRSTIFPTDFPSSKPQFIPIS